MNYALPPFANRSFRSLRKLLAFASVSVLASVSLAGCGLLGGAPEEEPAAPVQVQAQTAPSEIQMAGRLAFPNTAALSFDTGGVVGEVMVNEGDTVQSGQILAALDAESTTQLRAAVAGAELAVTSAENNLSNLRLEPGLRVAAAEMEVAGAELELDQAQDALDDLLQRPGVNVAGAQFAVAQAEIALDDAREQLDDLLEPQQIAVSGAEAMVAAARVELDAAQEAYDDIKDGSFPEETLRDARNGVSFAATALDAANRGRTDAETATQNALTQAEDYANLITEQYTGLFKFWFGSELTDAELQMTADEVLQEWGIDLDATFQRHNPEYTSVEPTPNNPDTRWNELTIWAWINLSMDFPGIVPTCTDEDPIGANQRCITRELQNAYDTYDAAHDALAAAQNSTATTAEQTADAVAAAEAALADAEDALQEVEDGPDASLVESAEKRLQLAHASLKEAEDDLAELTVDIDPLNVALARAAVGQAEVGVEEANDALESAMDDDLLIASAQKRIELADAALVDAENRVDLVQDLLLSQIAAAEAELDMANTNLDTAQENLDGAVIMSPMAGVVTLVDIEVDDPVGDEMAAITVVSTDVVEIEGVIDAAGRPYVSEGASAVVNIDSVGGTPLSGSVSFVASEPRTERGVIAYAVRIHVDVPAGVSVPASISAVSAVITSNQSALRYDGGLHNPGNIGGGVFTTMTAAVRTAGRIALAAA